MRSVLKAGESFLVIAVEVGRVVTEQRGQPVKWLLAHAQTNGSISLRLRGVADNPRVPIARVPEVGHAVADGFVVIEREAARPQYFTDTALEKVEELAQLAPEMGSLRVANGAAATNVTSESAVHVRQLLAPAYSAYGSIDGTIDAVNLHERRQFYVYDIFDGRRIRCEFGDRIKIEDIAHALTNRLRVHVYGTVNYRSDDQIESVTADDLHVSPPLNDLPTADDVRGILG